MSQPTVVAILTFLAAVATLASNTLPVTPEAKAVLTFAVLVIDAALSALFGAVSVKARQQRIETARTEARAMAKKLPGYG